MGNKSIEKLVTYPHSLVLGQNSDMEMCGIYAFIFFLKNGGFLCKGAVLLFLSRNTGKVFLFECVNKAVKAFGAYYVANGFITVIGSNKAIMLFLFDIVITIGCQNKMLSTFGHILRSVTEKTDVADVASVFIAVRSYIHKFFSINR